MLGRYPHRQRISRNGITTWIKGWKKNGWRTADKSPVKNIDLWRRLDLALGAHQVHWHWVKGHAGHALNERADELAREGLVAARAGAVGAMKESIVIPERPKAAPE